jgi:uncharacterized membrane protein
MKEKNAVIGLVVICFIFICFFLFSVSELYEIKSLVDEKENNINYSSGVFFSFLGVVVWFFVVCYFVKDSNIGKCMVEKLGFIMVSVFVIAMLMIFSAKYVFEGYFESKGYVKCADPNGVRTNIFLGEDYVLFLNGCPSLTEQK